MFVIGTVFAKFEFDPIRDHRADHAFWPRPNSDHFESFFEGHWFSYCSQEFPKVLWGSDPATARVANYGNFRIFMETRRRRNIPRTKMIFHLKQISGPIAENKTKKLRGPLRTQIYFNVSTHNSGRDHVSTSGILSIAARFVEVSMCV